MPEDKIVNEGGTVSGLPKAGGANIGGNTPRPITEKYLDELYLNSVNSAKGNIINDIPVSSFSMGGRYDKVRPFTDAEEMKAQQQSTADKWGNGLAKMTGIALTTFVSGTLGLVNGMYSSVAENRFTALFDNETTRNMDGIGKDLDNRLPNYETYAEKNAEWYSTDNLLTANFWSNKVVKNLGFAIGAIAGGVAWSSLFRTLGAINTLTKSGQAMEALSATETAMMSAPRLQQYEAISSALQGLKANVIAAPLTNSNRILTSVMGTFGEAAIESLQNMNEFRREAINEFIFKNGYAPIGDDLKEINAATDKVGNYTWGMNSLLLSATNYIQLPRMLGSSRKVDKTLINTVEETGTRDAKAFISTPLKRMQKAGNFLSHWFAPIEAFEEGAQFSIQQGTKSFFKRAYENQEDVQEFFSTMAEVSDSILTKGVYDTFHSKEGLESILIGGISGGLQQSGVIGTYKNDQNKTKVGIGKSGTIGEYGLVGTGGEMSRNTDVAITALNKTNLTKVLQSAINYVGIAINSQKLRQESIIEDNIAKEKNFEHDYTMSYVLPRVKYGKEDSIYNELKGYKEQAMSPTGFTELQTAGIALNNESASDFIIRLNNIEEITKETAKQYGDINRRYSAYRVENGQILYSDDIIDQMTYASAKISYFDKQFKLLGNEIVKNGLSINTAQGLYDAYFSFSKTNKKAFTALAKGNVEEFQKALLEEDDNLASKEMKVLNEINNRQDWTEDEKERVFDEYLSYLDAGKQRLQYVKEYNSLKNKPEDFKIDDVSMRAANAPIKANPKDIGKTIKVKTKNKEEYELEIGEIYFLGKVTEYDDSGKEVYRFPRLTVLGQNEDGTIKIKDNKGARDIDPDVLADYQLGKESSLLNNKKAKYFHEHINTIFEHYGIKINGKPVRGRLEFTPKKDKLIFVYKDAKGEIKRKEVTKYDFAARKGYTHGILKAVGTLTPTQKSAEEAYLKSKDSREEERLQEYQNTLFELFSEVATNLDNTDKQIATFKAEYELLQRQINELSEKISKGDLTKKNNFKATTNRAIKTANRLAREQEKLRLKIEELEGEKEQLEYNLQYIADLSSNITELPLENQTLISELNEQVLDLEIMQEAVDKQLTATTRLYDSTQSALDSAIAFIQDLISKFQKVYKGVPTTFNQEWVDFIKVNPNFLKLRPNYKEDLALLEDMIAFAEEEEINIDEEILAELSEKIKTLQEDIKELDKAILAKTVILRKFEANEREIQRKEKEFKKLQESQEFKEELFKQQKNTFSENNSNPKVFEAEAKKADEQVFASTIALGEDRKDEELPHHKRVNYFGSILPNLPDRNSYKALLVTANLGTQFEKLIDLVKGTYKSTSEDTEVVVAIFIQEDKEGNLFYINEKGEKLGGVTEDFNIDEIVFQVMPAATEKTNGGFSRFRDTTPADKIKQYIEQYRENRKEWFLSPSMKDRVQDISPSFGLVKDEFKTDTPQPASNIVDDITTPGLVVISTKESKVLTNNHQSVVAPLGTTWLVTDNVIKHLKNRKLTEKEQENIFNAILALSKFADEKTIKNNDTANLLFTYLRGIVYWGIPVNKAGKNSIWFEEGYLHFANNDSKIQFTPSAIKDKEHLVKTFLAEVYNNINVEYLRSGEPYFEASTINEKGEITEKIRWNTYQEYLLSDKNRTADQIPFTTNVPPAILDTGVQTRQGIYFTLHSLSNSYTYAEPIGKKTGFTVAPTVKEYSTTEKSTLPITPFTTLEALKDKKFVHENPSNKAVYIFTVHDNGRIEVNPKLGSANTIREKDLIDALAKGLLRELVQPTEAPAVVISSAPTSGITLVPGVKVYKHSKLNTVYTITITGEIGDLKIKVSPKLGEAEAIRESDLKMYIEKGLLVEVKASNSVESVFNDTPSGILAERAVANQGRKIRSRNSKTRIVTADAIKTEDWNKIERWLKNKLPGVPVYRVKNMIDVGTNLQAWGLFADGAIYLYENAELGTTYHEVFHAIMDHFTSSEEKALIAIEFKKRKGNFTSRGSNKSIAFKDASDIQIEEQLAEEFRNYVLAKENRNILGIIGKFFQELYSFISGRKSDILSIFKKINAGEYRGFVPGLEKLSIANSGIMDIDYISTDDFSDFKTSLVKKMNSTEQKDLLQHMTSMAFTYLYEDTADLFSTKTINKKDFYIKVKQDVTDTLIDSPFLELQEDNVAGKITDKQFNARVVVLEKLNAQIEDIWDSIEERHKNYMQTLHLKFDENDELVNTDENKQGRETGQDALAVDHIAKASFAIKLLVASLYETTGDVEFGYVLANPIRENSSINGDILTPFGRTFIQLINSLADSPSFDEMMNSLVQLAKSNSNYIALFTKLKGSRINGKIQWNNLNPQELQLLIAFFKTFSKQSPQVLTTYIGEDGNAYIGSGNIATAVEQLKETYENGFMRAVKNPPSEAQMFGTQSKIALLLFNKTKKGWMVNQELLARIDVSKTTTIPIFLKLLGIDINFNELTPAQQNIVASQARGIKDALSKQLGEVVTLTRKVIGINGPLNKIAEVVILSTKEWSDSVFYGVNGEKKQQFVEKNQLSKLVEVLNSDIPLSDTSFSYLETDVFSENSKVREKIKKGEKLSFGYIDGIVDQEKGKNVPTNKLVNSKRLLQSIILQLEGWYNTLVPADSSTEWIVKYGTFVSLTDITNNYYNTLTDIYKGYLESEIKLAQENRDHSIALKNRTNKLRFLQEILGDKLSVEAVKSKDFEKFYSTHKDTINNNLLKLLSKNASQIREELLQYNFVKENLDGTFTFPSLDSKNVMSLNKNAFTDKEFNNFTLYLAANYSIANIESHKLLFGDPYEYTDGLKRFKSFLSPAETTLSNSVEINSLLQKVYNLNVQEGDPGFRQFKDYLSTVALEDVYVTSDLYPIEDFPKGYKESDAQGLITDDANREFRIKASRWGTNDEQQYQYDKAWERNTKAKKGEYVYSSQKLKEADDVLLKEDSPEIESAYYVMKPIYRGNKYQSTINAPMIDKFSLAVLSYKALNEFAPQSNIVRLYNKMSREGIDYVVFESGRKVGNEGNNKIYGEDGKITKEKFIHIVKAGFDNLSFQVETAPHGDNLQTVGTQLTKLATLNMMAAGIPIDYIDKKDWNSLTEAEKIKASPLYEKIKHNQAVLENMMNNGYDLLLKKLGVIDTGRGFEIVDREKLAKELKSEIFKRDVNDNIFKALDGFAQGTVALESTPVYQQFKNILYSIIDKNISSLKVNGGAKVLMASTFFEDRRETKSGTSYYTESSLKSYKNEDGQRHIEVYISSSFIRNQLSKYSKLHSLTDEELFATLSDDVLKGIGFRIPTQNANSSDIFIIKKFLPRTMADTVVIPSDLVKKTGADFDIDKLSTYLKNIYVTAKGKIKEVPFFGFGEIGKNKFKELYESEIEEKIERNEQYDDFRKKLISIFETLESLNTNRYKVIKKSLSEEDGDFYDFHFNKIVQIFDQAEEQGLSGSQYLKNQQAAIDEKGSKLLTKQLDDEFKDLFVERMYKRSLENEYINSLSDLLSQQSNFKYLTSPNSADKLKALADEMAKLKGLVTDNYTTIDLLNMVFMTDVRHDYVIGKHAVGIGALNQTNHALNQRGLIYIDTDKLKSLPEDLKLFLGDAEILLPHNVRVVNGKEVASFSEIYDQAGDIISDKISMYIDGYVDIPKGAWIMNIGAYPNVASTFLLLEKLGVPMETVVYFMNQPIITDYLQKIEESGYVWLFMEDFVDDMLMSSKYKTDKVATKINVKTLKTNITKEFSTDIKQDIDAKAEQQLILKEFLKYASLAQHLFHVTQGSNYDTAEFSDPYLLLKKRLQVQKARETVISGLDSNNSPISGVDSLLNNSFISTTRDRLEEARDAVALFLPTESDRVRNIIENILISYANLPNKDFIKISQKVIQSFLDFVVQTQWNVPKGLSKTLIDEGNIPEQVKEIMNSLPKKSALKNNTVLNSLLVLESNKKGGTNNLKLKSKQAEIYQQNSIIAGFQELRDSVEFGHLYPGILRTALIQGLANSPISFTQLVPIEDLVEVLQPLISTLENIPNLENFKEFKMFERNNWNFTDIVPKRKEFKKTDRGVLKIYAKVRNLKTINEMQDIYGNKASAIGIDALNPMASHAVVTISHNYTADENGQSYSTKRREEMRNRGDYSYIFKGLFQKILDESGQPMYQDYYIKSQDRYGKTYFYKQINAWGDSFRAQEYYSTPQLSQINNGYVPVYELDDDVIGEMILREKVKVPVKSDTPQATFAEYVKLLGNKLGMTEKEFNQLTAAQQKAAIYQAINC